MRAKEPKRFESEKPYVIVAPIYVSRLPLEVEAYLKSCTFSGNKNVWFVVTCGGGMGGAAHQKRRNTPPFKESDQHVMGKRHGTEHACTAWPASHGARSERSITVKRQSTGTAIILMHNNSSEAASVSYLQSIIR